MTTSKGILQRRQTRKVAGLQRRVARLERALGSLLIYMAAIGLVGPEDYHILREELEAAGIPLQHPDGKEPAPRSDNHEHPEHRPAAALHAAAG